MTVWVRENHCFSRTRNPSPTPFEVAAEVDTMPAGGGEDEAVEEGWRAWAVEQIEERTFDERAPRRRAADLGGQAPGEA